MKISFATGLAVLLFSASLAEAATLVQFSGNSTGSLASGSATISLSSDGRSLTGSMTNTSPFDARITAFGFDIGQFELAWFNGGPITDPGDTAFAFQDGDLGTVPQFNGVELDFGYITGKNFNGGHVNDGLDNFLTLEFLITGPFGGLSEAALAEGLFVRFQRVGANGQGSDVAAWIPSVTTVPEPASMVLFGSGLAWLAARRKRRSQNP